MERYRKILIGNNGLGYKVLSVEEIKYKISKKGTIERYLRGDNLESWLMDYTDYHVKVINNKENIERIFVLTQSDAEKRLFY